MPCTHESLGEKQGKPGSLAVQTPGANKCGDRGQVKRAPRTHRERAKLSGESESLTTDVLRISVTEGSGHVCPGKLNCPPLPSGDRIPDVRYPGGWNVNGQDSGCEISGWMECRPDRISDMRYPGGMRENFRPGGMSDATCRKGASACPREREPRDTFLGRIPQWVVVQAVQGGSGRLHNHQGKKL